MNTAEKEISVIINQHGVKRIIEGPFEMCMSRDVARSMIVQMAAAYGIVISVYDPDNPESPVYGWVKIYREPPIEAIPNTPPLPWVP